MPVQLANNIQIASRAGIVTEAMTANAADTPTEITTHDKLIIGKVNPIIYPDREIKTGAAYRRRENHLVRQANSLHQIVHIK